MSIACADNVFKLLVLLLSSGDAVYVIGGANIDTLEVWILNGTTIIGTSPMIPSLRRIVGVCSKLSRTCSTQTLKCCRAPSSSKSDYCTAFSWWRRGACCYPLE